MDVLALFAAPLARLVSVGMRLLVKDARDIIFDTRVGLVLFVVRAWRRTDAILYNRPLEFFALHGLRALPTVVSRRRRRRRRWRRLGNQCRRVRGLRVCLLGGRVCTAAQCELGQKGLLVANSADNQRESLVSKCI